MPIFLSSISGLKARNNDMKTIRWNKYYWIQMLLFLIYIHSPFVSTERFFRMFIFSEIIFGLLFRWSTPILEHPNILKNLLELGIPLYPYSHFVMVRSILSQKFLQGSTRLDNPELHSEVRIKDGYVEYNIHKPNSL